MSDTKTIINALRTLALESQSGYRVAKDTIAEAATRMEEMDAKMATQTRGMENAVIAIKKALGVNSGYDILDAIVALKDRVKDLEDLLASKHGGEPIELLNKLNIERDRVAKLIVLGDELALWCAAKPDWCVAKPDVEAWRKFRDEVQSE